jgi:hypothetical protein
MSKTRAQLVARSLQKNKVIGVGQTASAGVSQRVDDVVDSLMTDLGERGIFQWGDPDDLPEAAFEHLADLLANATAPDFGKPADENRRLMAEGRLNLLNGISLSHQPLKAEYF